MSYSKGVFFRLLNNNIKLWQQELDFVNSLPNLQHLELWLENLHLTPKHITWLNQNLKPYTLIIHAPFTGFHPLSFNLPLRQAAQTIINQTISIGQKLTAKLITFHLGRLLFFDSPSTTVSRIEPWFNQALARTESPSLTIENMPYRDSWERGLITLTELEQLWPNFSSTNFTLDIGHCIRSQENPIAAIQNHHSHLKNIHLHDGTPEKDHQALGKGILNLKKLLATLNQVNYQRFLTLETLNFQDTASSWQILTKTK